MTKSQAFPADFCSETTRACLQLIAASCSFTLRSMPGLGVSFFLKHLIRQRDFYWIPLNLYELPKPKPQTLVQHLAHVLGCPIPNKHDSLAHCIEDRIHQLAQKHERVVLVFNRFDALENATGTLMLNTLRSVRDIDREKIVFVFAASKSLANKLAPQHMDCFNLFSKEEFLRPYKPDELAFLLSLDKSASLVRKHDVQRVIAFSGGHHSLAQTLLRCQSLDNPLGDPMVRLQLDYLLSFLTPNDVQILTHETRFSILEPNHPLLRLGIVRHNSSGYSLFTPLLAQHLQTKHTQELPPKEKALLGILQHQTPDFVSKDELIEQLWNNTRDGGSEWALTALLYRLRKHPSFIASGNTIVTYKKRGYALVEPQ